MGRKPSTRRISAFQNAVKVLRQFGFVDYDETKPLSKYKANRAKKLIAEHHHIVAHPEEYVKRRVSKQTKQNWSEQGYPNNDKYLIIPKQGYDVVHVSKNKMKRSNYDKVETTYSATGTDLYNQLTKVTKRELRPHEYITIRIGDGAMFHSRFKSMDDLLNYINKWHPKDKGVLKEEVIRQFNIVRFFDHEELREYGDMDDEEYDE